MRTASASGVNSTSTAVANSSACATPRRVHHQPAVQPGRHRLQVRPVRAPPPGTPPGARHTVATAASPCPCTSPSTARTPRALSRTSKKSPPTSVPRCAARYRPAHRTGPTRSGTGGATARCAASAMVRSVSSWTSRRRRTNATNTLSAATKNTVQHIVLPRPVELERGHIEHDEHGRAERRGHRGAVGQHRQRRDRAQQEADVQRAGTDQGGDADARHQQQRQRPHPARRRRAPQPAPPVPVVCSHIPTLPLGPARARREIRWTPSREAP